MNHLAHAWLTPDPDPAVLAGNVLGDYFRAGSLLQLSSGVRRGFDLHQQIDRFSDAHPDFRKAREHISPARRRYAPVILDIFFDLHLAGIWDSQPSLRGSLEHFSESTATRLLPMLDQVPLRFPGHIRRMVEARWLADYASKTGACRVFQGLSRRARPGNPLAGAEEDFFRAGDTLFSAFEKIREDLAREFLTGPTPKTS